MTIVLVGVKFLRDGNAIGVNGAVVTVTATKDTQSTSQSITTSGQSEVSLSFKPPQGETWLFHIEILVPGKIINPINDRFLRLGDTWTIEQKI